jgi:hypothetical protein
MSGRRSHPRFAVANPWNGAIKLLSDIVVNRTEQHELLAISNSAAVVGEELSLDLFGGGQNIAMKVRVLESRPVIVDGTVRHRVRLGLPAVLRDASSLRPAVSDTVTFEPAAQRVAEAG